LLKQYKYDIKNLERTLNKIQYKVIRNQEIPQQESSFLSYFLKPDTPDFNKIIKKMHLCNKIKEHC